MEPRFDGQVTEYRVKQRRRQRWYKIVSVLACVVVFCTTYALILPAITMETQRVLDCQYKVHIHTDECYDGDGNLICGQADFVVHTHTEDCYDEHGDLVCPLQEIEAHEHTEECYTETRTLICDQEEDPGHEHTAECYTYKQKLLCPQEEDEGHQHTDACYGHTQGSLICTLEESDEHQHGDACYEWTEELICGEEERAPGHIHTDDCYEWEQALTCTEEARPAGHVHTDECYETVRTLTCEKEEIILHTHTDECYDEDGTLICGQLEILEHIHTDECFYLVETQEPEDDAPSGVYAYEDETISAEVTLAEGSTVPEDAVLVVRPITGAALYSADGETGGSEDLVRQAEEAVGQPVTDLILYDISFYTSEGDYLPVEDTATVSIRFRENVLPAGSGGVAVLHYREDGELPVVLDAVDVESGEDDALSAVTFQTEGFSEFGIAVLADTDAKNAFTLTYNSYTITFSIVDAAGKAISGDYSAYNRTADVKEKYIFSEIAPTINGYTYSGAKYGTISVASVGTNGYTHNYGTVSAIFQVYESEPIVSGSWYSRSEDLAVTLIYIKSNCITYDLNFPLIYGKAISWETTPTLTDTSQDITSATALFAKPTGYYAKTGPAGIEGLYRFNVNITDSLQSEPFYNNFDWYGEYRFDGWEYTDEKGFTHLFTPEAAITRTDSGIQVTDVDGTSVLLPTAGTVLRGKWTEVSNVVTMFVNYKGTILDVEGDVSGRRQNTFTKSVAVGHVFYGTQTVGKDGTFAVDANAAITAMFQPSFDADNPNTQIVIEYLRTCTKQSTNGTGYETKVNLASHGANSKVLEANTLRLLKETGRTIQLSTSGTENPTIDNSLCDTDHYQIRWYVLKEQTDTWHIDGVLVAKTEELAVTKTFTGLDDATILKLLDETTGSGFNISVELGVTGYSQPYITMLPKNQTNGKQYVYTGQSGSIHSYHWTLYAINGEKYTLTEKSYELDDYDVSTIVVQYYLDDDGNTRINYAYGNNTDIFPADIPQVEGGRTTAVSFNNLYTQTGTGAFAITKREAGTDPANVGGTLQGAVFTLTDSSGTVIETVTSNVNGTAYFNNLPEGTYTLKETKAPEGYTASDKTWTVVVKVEPGTVDANSHVLVTVYENGADGTQLAADNGTVCYDSNNGGVQKSYEIENDPESSTVTVRKTFTGMTLDELDAVFAQSVTNLSENPKGYYIQLQGNVSAGGDVDGDGKRNVTLTLDQAQRSQDGRTFTWTIHNLDTSANYTITEHNYLHDNYIDTVVTMAVNGTAYTPYEDEDLKTCDISKVTFRDDASDTVTITNHYTNTFDLKLQKVDSATKAPLTGAVFDIYGPYADATNTQKYITYEEDGRTRRAFFIGTTDRSDVNGIATYSGLKLSKDGSTFVYVIKEFQSPNGYVKLEEPIVQSVTITSEGYDGGVLTVPAPNLRDKDYVHRTLDTVKVWSPSTPPTGATVTLELYQVTHDERNVLLEQVVDAVKVATVTLDGTADPVTTVADGEITAYESAPWTATWTNLPSAADTYDDDGKHYHYFVREVTTINGYAASYTCYDLYGETPEGAIQTLQVTNEDGVTETFQGVLIADMDEAYTATVVNTTSFELPETGGSGIFSYAIGGALFMACSLLCGYLLRRKGERRSAR